MWPKRDHPLPAFKIKDFDGQIEFTPQKLVVIGKTYDHFV